MRYLVAYGIFGKNKTEIVDISDTTKSCILDDIPFRYQSAGGLLGTTPVICGGLGGMNECLRYGSSEVITMNDRREYLSSVALNTSLLWILGGKNGGGGSGQLKSTEFISIDGAVNGPTLPEAVSDSCAVKFIPTGNVYLIGGIISSRIATNNIWVADPANEFAFTQGPSMVTARRAHACGTMSSGDKSIIVAAGGNGLKSVEIMDPLSNQWTAGK